MADEIGCNVVPLVDTSPRPPPAPHALLAHMLGGEEDDDEDDEDDEEGEEEPPSPTACCSPLRELRPADTMVLPSLEPSNPGTPNLPVASALPMPIGIAPRALGTPNHLGVPPASPVSPIPPDGTPTMKVAPAPLATPILAVAVATARPLPPPPAIGVAPATSKVGAVGVAPGTLAVAKPISNSPQFVLQRAIPVASPTSGPVPPPHGGPGWEVGGYVDGSGNLVPEFDQGQEGVSALSEADVDELLSLPKSPQTDKYRPEDRHMTRVSPPPFLPPAAGGDEDEEGSVARPVSSFRFGTSPTNDFEQQPLSQPSPGFQTQLLGQPLSPELGSQLPGRISRRVSGISISSRRSSDGGEGSVRVVRRIVYVAPTQKPQ